MVSLTLSRFFRALRALVGRCQKIECSLTRESSGESTSFPPMWLGFDSQPRRHMWVEFVGSLLCSERFSAGYSGFPLLSKTNI